MFGGHGQGGLVTQSKLRDKVGMQACGFEGSRQAVDTKKAK
jgi:hypothetical protein